MSKTMIITDTCSDLSVDLVDKYDVEILAATFHIDGKYFVEGVDFSHENFYEILPTPHGKIKGVAIPAAVFLDRYKNAATCGFTHVLLILAGPDVFPMHISAREAAELFREQNPTADLRIEIVDTNTYSMATGMLVLEAAKLADEGVEFDEILEHISNDAKRMTMLVDAFHIPKSFMDPTKPWSKWLSLKSYHPFPTLKVTTEGATELPIIKGDHSAFDQYLTYCIEALRQSKPDYSIGYATRVNEARALAMLIEEAVGYPPVSFYKLGAISAYGASKAAIALCYKDA